MLRKLGPVIPAILLIAFVATACIVTTRPPRGQVVEPVSSPQKHTKHKDGHDEGHHDDGNHDDGHHDEGHGHGEGHGHDEGHGHGHD